MNKDILKKINVLYVEDEDDVREFTSKTISSIVNKVIIAKDGQEGLDKFLENQEINLILTDINMPKMGGLEMCEEIRKKDQEIPIVITSAHSDPDFLKKAIDVKVSAYAMKPIDLYKLIESIIMAFEPIYLRKELVRINLNLENQVEEAIKQTKSILDAQDNMVVLTDLDKIIDVNRKFLEFFDSKDLDEFNSKNTSVLSKLKKARGFFDESILNGDENWILKIKELSELDRVVKMENLLGEDRIFTINIDDYEHKGEHYVISFTDITELKEKSNLLEYQATHDQLTGLFNRQKFNDVFAKEIKRGKRYGNFLSLIIFDIDNFKKFNDDFGHATGDEVLKTIAKIVYNSLREHDIAVRWGGEEFLVLLPQTNISGAMQVSEKIRTAIQNFKSELIPREITASFGVTELKEDDNEESLLNKADKALYEAKAQGKNRSIASS